MKRSVTRAGLGPSLMTGALLMGALMMAAGAGQPRAQEMQPWSQVIETARGQEVFWNAWGGDERINAYIAWVGARVEEDYGITLTHVKLADTSEAVNRVLAERAGDVDAGGAIDLIWINGENFHAMKENGLLYGPFAEDLPNFALVDVENKPTTRVDFTVPVDGLEAPWGMAKINFIYDSARVASVPSHMIDFLTWAQLHPGRFTYPAPPDFIGSTFLKQALYELVGDPAILQQVVEDADTFNQVSAPLWAFLDQLHPHLWRGGETFPASNAQQRQMLDDGEIDIMISFYPSDAASFVASGLLPESARVFVLAEGTIGNTHFVAIPFNSSATEAARVVANFLMSSEAQARKQNLEIWGDETVLDVTGLTGEDRALFDALPHANASISPENLGPTLPEPHPSWMTRIEAAWLARYAN